MAGTSNERNIVFISYSHADRRHLDQLLPHLERLRRDRKIEVWADTRLKAGDVWREEIARGLASARVAIVLVSAAFLASKFIAENELPPLLTAATNDGLLILPVIVGACDFQDSELAHVQAVNAPSKPLDAMTRAQRNVVWLQVARRIKDAFPATPQPAESADELIVHGEALIAQRRYADAIRVFERATQLNPARFDAWVNLGHVYGELGRWQDSLIACDQALALDLNNARAWNNKGGALIRLGHSQEALDALEQALALDPAYASAWANKGGVLSLLGRPQEALDAYERALALDPDNAMTWSNKGATLWQLSRFQEALVAFERAQALDPTLDKAWHNKAKVWRGVGLDAAAEVAEHKARELGWKDE